MMKIEKATPLHIDRIAELDAICFRDAWSHELIGRHLSEFIVAVEDDAVTGYAMLSTVLDEGELDRIAVDFPFRRMGVGELLLDAVIADCKSAGVVLLTLEVRASNLAAIALYKKAGFCEAGRRKNYYEKPREDAIIMALVM